MIDQDVAIGDAGIRQALHKDLSDKHFSETDTVIIDELGICRGQVRVDIAVVNGALHGYEIKSDRDNLRRLGIQVEYYSRVLDRATLVVGDRHLSDAIDILPAWWGVMHVQSTSNGPRFKIVRSGLKNPCRDQRSLVELLWLDDAIALLERSNSARGVRGKPRRLVWDRVCACFSIEEIANAVCAQLKARTMNQALR